jgi:hypothetical protein
VQDAGLPGRFVIDGCEWTLPLVTKSALDHFDLRVAVVVLKSDDAIEAAAIKVFTIDKL